jgi:flagellin-like hook-associated protein FlgL
MDVRITALMPSQQILRNLDQVTNQILQDQTEIATGKVLTQPSDNPAAVTQDLLTQEVQSQVTGWQNVAGSALAVAQATDQALSQIEQAATNAYATALSAVGPTGPAGLGAVIQELQQIQQSVGQLANTKVGDIYLFGGDSGQPPWSSSTPGMLVGGPAMMVNVGSGLSVPQNMAANTTPNGGPVGDLLAALQGVITALQAPPVGQTYTVNIQFNYGSSTYTTTTSYTTTSPPTTITASAPAGAPPGSPTSITAVFEIPTPAGTVEVADIPIPLSDFSGGVVTFTGPTWGEIASAAAGLVQQAQANLVAAHAAFGTDMQRIEAAQAALSTQATALQSTRASLESAKIPNVVADLANQEATYQAVLQSASNVILPTLATYLGRYGP